MRSCVCVCVCARARVCICVFILFHRKGFFRQQRCLTSKDEIPARRQTGEKMIWYIDLAKRWYISIGCKSAPMILKQTSDKKILKIRSLFLYFESSPWHQHRNLFVLIECSSIAPTMSDELFLLMHWVEPFS